MDIFVGDPEILSFLLGTAFCIVTTDQEHRAVLPALKDRQARAREVGRARFYRGSKDVMHEVPTG